MQQKLITLDLDGTTLNNHSQLSPLTIKTLQKATRLDI
ncbi:cof family protein [Pediococcus acidilactici NGRI 0510Q]|nr:cof family protein [Pediococcus acidilactici NGRI 0510Q]